MRVPEHEQGGDPACWAHVFDEEPEPASEPVAEDVPTDQ